MNIAKKLFRITCRVMCILSVFSLPASAQVELLVTYTNQSTETFSIPEEGKLHFTENELIIEDVAQSPVTIVLSSIRKLNVYHKEDNVSITENNIVGQSDIILYPNPAENYIRIKSSDTKELSISIYSISGQVLLKGIFLSGEQIDVSHFSSGLYFVKIDKQIIKFSKL